MINWNDYKVEDKYIYPTDLDLNVTPCVLPKNLIVKGKLTVNKKCDKLPSILKVVDLDISNSLVTRLPEDLYVENYLNMKNTLVKVFPDKLFIGNSINLINTKVKNLPRVVRELVYLFDGKDERKFLLKLFKINKKDFFLIKEQYNTLNIKIKVKRENLKENRNLRILIRSHHPSMKTL